MLRLHTLCAGLLAASAAVAGDGAPEIAGLGFFGVIALERLTPLL